MNPAPKRRWFQFSLRTLLIIATLWGCCLGWLGYQVSWIRQRKAALEWMATQADYWQDVPIDQRPHFGPNAPWSIRLWGEQGLSHVAVVEQPDAVTAKQRELERLFPEAEVLVAAPGLGYKGMRAVRWNHTPPATL